MRTMEAQHQNDVRRYASRDPEFDACMERAGLHLARARASIALTKLLLEEHARQEAATRRPRGIFIGRL
jgi:hypothetical protein